MDFTLTLEQQLLKDSAAKLLADQCDFSQRTAVAASPRGWSDTLWRQYAELGLLGIGIPEELGGTGGGPFETMVVAETMGRHLALEPYVPTAVLARELLLSAGTPDQVQSLLPRIAAGELRLAVAALERQSRFDLFDVATTATRSGSGWVLNGPKPAVWHGDQADQVIVTARVSGNRRDDGGIGLFLVDGHAEGLSRTATTRLDGHRAADLALHDVAVPGNAALEVHEDALPHLEAAREVGVVALMAKAIGCMDELLVMTVEYLKTRRQFGRTIGSFQSLQHRAAEMLCHIEHARSMAILATSWLRQPPSRERSRWIAGARVRNLKACRFVGEQGVQLHGGIGITMEHKVAHLFRHLTAQQSMLGDADHHLERFSQLDAPAENAAPAAA